MKDRIKLKKTLNITATNNKISPWFMWNLANFESCAKINGKKNNKYDKAAIPLFFSISSFVISVS